MDSTPNLDRAARRREYARRWRERNREKIRQYDKEWRGENKDRVAGYDRKTYVKRKDSVNAYIRGWRSANPEKVREYNRKHVAKLRSIKKTKAQKKSRQRLKTGQKAERQHHFVPDQPVAQTRADGRNRTRSHGSSPVARSPPINPAPARRHTDLRCASRRSYSLSSV